MTVTAKTPISTGDGKGGRVVIPKGTKGIAIAVSNSVKIRQAFPNLEHKIDGWFFICNFPGYVDEILCSGLQVEFE